MVAFVGMCRQSTLNRMVSRYHVVCVAENANGRFVSAADQVPREVAAKRAAFNVRMRPTGHEHAIGVPDIFERTLLDQVVVMAATEDGPVTVALAVGVLDLDIAERERTDVRNANRSIQPDRTVSANQLCGSSVLNNEGFESNILGIASIEDNVNVAVLNGGINVGHVHRPIVNINRAIAIVPESPLTLLNGSGQIDQAEPLFVNVRFVFGFPGFSIPRPVESDRVCAAIEGRYRCAIRAVGRPVKPDVSLKDLRLCISSQSRRLMRHNHIYILALIWIKD